MLGLPCIWGAFHGDHFIHIWCLVFLASLQWWRCTARMEAIHLIPLLGWRSLYLNVHIWYLVFLPCTLTTVHWENGWSFYSYLGIGFPCFLALAHFLCCTKPPFKHAFGHSCAKARKLTQISSWPRSWPDLKYKRIQMCKKPSNAGMKIIQTQIFKCWQIILMMKENIS